MTSPCVQKEIEKHRLFNILRSKEGVTFKVVQMIQYDMELVTRPISGFFGDEWPG